jgi:hypothetical protein
MKQSPIYAPSSLERVREGMTVLDHAGRRLGTVARIRMGDPQAVTTRGEAPPVTDVGVVVAPAEQTGGSLGIGAVAPVLGGTTFGADVPDPLAQELLRTGFVEVDGPELEGPARYVPGERIAEVSGDTVRLGPDASSTAAPAPPTMRGSSAVEPVLRTYLGTPREPSGPVPKPVVLGVAAIAALGSTAALGWLVWRRRRAGRQPLSRVRRGGQQVVNTLADEKGVSSGVGVALLLAVLLFRIVRKSRSAETEPARASACR